MSRVLGDGWGLPALDHLNTAFFTNGKLVVQQCSKCALFQHPPEDVCQACQSFELRHFESAGAGKVESVAVVHHPIHPGLADQVPYAIVVVSVDDAPGVLVVGNGIGKPPGEFRIGEPVRAVMEDVDDPKTGQRLTIPQWEAAG